MDALTKNQRRYLSRRECGWCGQTLDRTCCGAIYERCSDQVMRERREKCLSEYRPRKVAPTAQDTGAAG